jgi:hypothetical protein
MVDKVTIFALCCFLEESSQITFLAYTVDHVGCFEYSWPHDLCNKHFVCCNPNLGFETKARAYKDASQEGNLGVWESVRMNTHTPK